MEIFFVTGVNGVGKSTIIPHLRELLPADAYRVRDFDERGVPENAGKAWRVSETAFWLEEARRDATKGFLTIVCGFVKIEDLGEALAQIGTRVGFMLLDADETSIEARLRQRYSKDGLFDPTQTVIGKPVETFIAGNVYIRKSLKKACLQAGCKVVETTGISPQEVANRVSEIILRK